MYGIISKYYLINENNQVTYTLRYIDETNLTDLLPKREISIKTESELLEIYNTYGSLKCANFFFRDGKLEITNKIPTLNAYSNMLNTSSLQYCDDVWNLLYTLSQSEAQLVLQLKEHVYSDSFTRLEKTYNQNASTLKFGSKHANCSLSIYADGKLQVVENYEPKTIDCKKWVSKYIIKDNKLEIETLGVLMTEETLEMIQSITDADIRVANITTLSTPNLKTENDLIYAFIDLTSIPLILDTSLGLDSTFIYETVKNYDFLTLQHKMNLALIKYVQGAFPQVCPTGSDNIEYSQHDLYKDTEEKTLGVNYQISGFKSLPSANKILQKINIDNIVELFALTTQGVNDLLESPQLKYQPLIFRTVLANSLKFIDSFNKHSNPLNFYKALLNYDNQVSSSKSLMKQRLNYARSGVLKTLENRVVDDTLITNQLQSQTLDITIKTF